MKKLLVFICLMSFSCISVIAQEATQDLLENTQKINGNAPKFKFIGGDVHDFKTVKEGTVVKYSFVFINTGKEPLVVQNAAGSCGCTVPEWPKSPVMPGKKGSIIVTFNSKGQGNGIFNKDIYIQSNAVTKSDRYTLHITGNIVEAAIKK
jgi:Protein of unknown function (DUF1573)